MNHCIPDRKLRPAGAPIYSGFVVSSPLAGIYSHYVFRDKDSKLFTMSADLFKCHNSYLKTTEVIRREQPLEFGEHINFTADASNRIIDYEKSMPLHEVDCFDNQFLIKTVCVLPPMELHPLKLWTTTFGFIDLNTDEAQIIHTLAACDIPIDCWVSINVVGDSLEKSFSSMCDEGVNVEDREIAWTTNWNYKNKPTSGLTWDVTDSEDSASEEKLIEKNEEQALDIKTKLKGILIGQKEIFCPALRDHRVFMGLWKPEDSKALPLNYELCFDAFYSDIRQEYIAYHYVVTDDQICEVYLDDNNKPTITEYVYFPNMEGSLYCTTYFGFIADPRRTLGTLPYAYEYFEEAVEVPVNIIDKGPNQLARFVLDDNQPIETKDLVEEANQYMTKFEYRIQPQENDESEKFEPGGFVVNSFTGRFFSPDYPTQFFVFPEEHRSEFPVGYWSKFEAVFSTETNGINYHAVTSADIDWDKGVVPHTCLEKKITRNGNTIQTLIKYEFKIEVELVDTERGMLYNPTFGYVSDPEKVFKKRPRIKKYDIIVEEDNTAEAFTLFKLKRMANHREKMQSEKNKGPNNGVMELAEEEELFEDGLGLCGLEMGDVIDDWKEKPSQVDFNAEYSVRERKLEATKRKRERKKREKAELERLEKEEEKRRAALAEAEGADDAAIQD